MGNSRLINQKGFVGAFDAMILLSVLAFASAQFFQITVQENERDRANASGAQLAQYQVGVSKFISFNQYGGSNATPTPLAQYLNANGNTSLGNAIVFNGTAWLKKYDANTCPTGLQGSGLQTANQSFLPCLFKDTTNLRQTYSMAIWLDTVQARIVGQTTIAGVNFKGEDRRDLTSLVANKAASGYSSISQDSLSTLDYDHATNTIVLTSSNAPSNSTWLRVDGSNTMQADIDVGGYSISNGLNANFSGTVTAKTADIVKDAGGLGGDLTVENNTTTNDLTVTNIATIKSIALNAGVNLDAVVNGVVSEFNLSNITPGNVANLNVSRGDITITNATPILKLINDAQPIAQIEGTSPNEMTVSFQKADGTGDTGTLNVDGDIYSQDVNRFTSQGVYDVSIVANGDNILQPKCPANRTPQVFLGAASIGRSGTVKPIGAVKTYASDPGSAPASWNVYMEIVDEDGTHGGTNAALPLPFPNSSILAVRKCT